MLHSRLFLSSSVTMMLLAPTSYAEDIAVGTVVGTTGIGVEAQYKLSDSVILRGGPNYLDFSYDSEIDDVDYEFDVEYSNLFVGADWHPGETPWFISAGVAVNDNSIAGLARPTANVEIGNRSYTPGEVGQIDGTIETNTVVPYLGVGWSNSFYSESAWSFGVNAGVYYTGSPNVELTGNGTLAGDPVFANDIEREEQNVEDDIDWIQLYPVLTVGVNYRF